MAGNKFPELTVILVSSINFDGMLSERILSLLLQSFFDKGFSPKGINSTILALIPKKKQAVYMRVIVQSGVATYFTR